MNSLTRILTSAAFGGLLTLGAAQSLPNAPYLSLSRASVYLLREPEVRKDLKLSTDQAKSVDKVFASHDEREQKELATPEPSDKVLEDLEKATADEAAKALSADQKKRLLEIALQERGPAALADDEIASKLKLSTEVKASVAAILETADKREEDFEAEVAAKMDSLPEPKTDDERKADQKKRDEIYNAAEPKRTELAKQRKADEEKALALLSPDQLKRWKDLLGRKYEPKG